MINFLERIREWKRNKKELPIKPQAYRSKIDEPDMFHDERELITELIIMSASTVFLGMMIAYAICWFVIDLIK